MQGSIPDWELASWRLLTKTAYACAVLGFKRELPSVPKDIVVYLTLYSLMYTAYNFFIFTSYNCLALGTSASLFTIVYMTAGTCLSFAFGLEDIKWVKLLAIIICSIGALLVSQPKFLHLDQSEAGHLYSNSSDIVTCENGTMPGGDASNIEQFGKCYTKGVIFSMFAGLAYALFNFIQKMKLQDLSTNVLVFYASSIGGTVSWITAFVTEDITLPHSENYIILFVAEREGLLVTRWLTESSTYQP